MIPLVLRLEYPQVKGDLLVKEGHLLVNRTVGGFQFYLLMYHLNLSYLHLKHLKIQNNNNLIY